MTISQAGPTDALRASLEAALDAENARFASFLAEHEAIVAHITAAMAMGAEAAAPVPAGTNGHSTPAPPPERRRLLAKPTVPEVEPDDEEVNVSAMTMEQACLTIMASRPGETWRAEDLERLLAAGGWTNPKLSSIRACLSQAFRHGKLTRSVPGEYVLPA